MNATRSRYTALEIGVPLLLVAAWWLISAGSTNFYFPPLVEILAAFQQNWLFERVLSDVVPSVLRMLAGFVMGTAVGLALGTLVAQSRAIRNATAPIIEFLRAIPSPALIPASLVLIGIGDTSKIALIAFVATWPVLLSTTAGMSSLDATLKDTTRMYGIRRGQYLLRVAYPAAGPQIFAGIRTALALALIMMIVSEMTGATNGIGYFVVQSQRTFAIADMWSGILLLGILGYLLSLIFTLIERHVLGWHAASRQPTA